MRIARTAPALLIVVAAACGTAAPTEPGAVQPRYDGGNTIGSGSSVGDSLGIGRDSVVVVQGGGAIGSGY